MERKSSVPVNDLIFFYHSHFLRLHIWLQRQLTLRNSQCMSAVTAGKSGISLCVGIVSSHKDPRYSPTQIRWRFSICTNMTEFWYLISRTMWFQAIVELSKPEVSPRSHIFTWETELVFAHCSTIINKMLLNWLCYHLSSHSDRKRHLLWLNYQATQATRNRFLCLLLRVLPSSTETLKTRFWPVLKISTEQSEGSF